MSERIVLKGVGWDHPRCMSPLIESTKSLVPEIAPELAVTWDTRSLSHFGDGQLEELLGYDLVIFDHPYCGQIARNGWFVNLKEALTDSERSAFANDSLGPSWISYHTDDGIWGLPIDAAAQVAACRPDLLDRLDATPPSTLDDVFSLAERAGAANLYVGVPFYPIDAICMFLTLAANRRTPVSRRQEFFPEHADTVEILEALKHLARISHPASRDWNPIRCFDHMSTADDVCYVPYAFGYTNYARSGTQKPLKFVDIPGFETTRCAGALLGGAGIGINAGCSHPALALEYAKRLCAPDYQAGPYFRDGGQPASLSAWRTPANDDASHDFFSGTIETMQNAYLRPTFDGYVDHFRAAGPRIRAFMLGEGDARALADWLRQDYFE